MEITKKMKLKIRKEAEEWSNDMVGKHSPIRLDWLTKELIDFAIEILEKYAKD